MTQQPSRSRDLPWRRLSCRLLPFVLAVAAGVHVAGAQDNPAAPQDPPGEADSAPAADAACPEGVETRPLSSLRLEARVPEPGLACVTSPVLGDGKQDLVFCWLPTSAAGLVVDCKAAIRAGAASSNFAVAVEKNKVLSFLEPGAKLPTGSWVIRFAPSGRLRGIESAVLRIEPEEDPQSGRNYGVDGIRDTYDDSRYRVALYSGVAYLHSQENFASAFPEIYATIESRFLERERVSGKRAADGSPREPKPLLLRGYLRAGLTATSQEPSPNLLEVNKLEGGKSLEVTGGIGFGQSWSLGNIGIENTSRFATLALARVGVLTLEEPTEDGDSLPFQWFAGLRIENEDGHFQGAFAEVGVGGSDQFTHKKSPRLRFEGLIPFSEPRTLGFAIRMTIDRPFPGVDVDTPESRAGDVKLSFLVRVDIRKIFESLSGEPSE